MSLFRSIGRLRRWLWLLLAMALLSFAWLARPMLLPGGGEATPLPTAAFTLQRPERLRVLFAGDTHFGESYSSAPRGYQRPIAGVESLAQSADFALVNLETPLTRRTDSPLRRLKRWAHWGDPDQTAGALARLRVRAVSLANDHAFDAFAPGLEDTLAALSTGRIAPFGAGTTVAEASQPWRADLVIGRHAVHLVVIGALARAWTDWLTGAYATSSGSGTYPLARAAITRQIQAIRQADPQAFVVVFPHWGSNYEWRSRAQSELGRRMIEAGADLVLGHGAHLFQEVEPYQGRLIVHSLGNFVFLSPGRYESRGMHPFSLAVRLDFADRGDRLSLTGVLYFLASNNHATDYRPHVLDGDDFALAERYLLEQGTLPDELRSELRRLVHRTRDEVGQGLAIELGTVRGQNLSIPSTRTP